MEIWSRWHIIDKSISENVRLLWAISHFSNLISQIFLVTQCNHWLFMVSYPNHTNLILPWKIPITWFDNVAHAMINEPSWYMYYYKIRHVAEYTIPNKFWKENRRILIQNLRNSVFLGFVDTKPIWLRVMGWRWRRDMSQQEPIVTHFTDVYICNRASMR